MTMSNLAIGTICALMMTKLKRCISAEKPFERSLNTLVAVSQPLVAKYNG